MLEKQNMEKYDQKERTKWENQKKKKQEIAKIQQEQCAEKRKLQEIQRQEKIEENKRMLEHIKQINLDYEKKAEKQRQHHEKMKMQMVEELSDQLRIKQEFAEEDKKLNEKYEYIP